MHMHRRRHVGAHPHIRYTRAAHVQACTYERGSVAYERASVETGSRVSSIHPCATRTGMRISSVPYRPRARELQEPEAYARESESVCESESESEQERERGREE